MVSFLCHLVSNLRLWSHISVVWSLFQNQEKGRRKEEKEERKRKRREIEEIRNERREEEKRRNNEGFNLEKQADSPLKLK